MNVPYKGDVQVQFPSFWAIMEGRGPFVNDHVYQSEAFLEVQIARCGEGICLPGPGLCI